MRSIVALVLCLPAQLSMVYGDEANPNLISHYPMDSSADFFVEDMVTGLSALATGVRTVQGKVGQAQHFGSESVMVAPASASDLPVDDEISISMWLKPQAGSHIEARFLSKAYGVQDSEHYFMVGAFQQDALRFRLKTGDGAGLTSTLITRRGALTTNIWTFVTFTYDSRFMRIYKDGELLAETAKTGIISRNATVPWAIGNQPRGAGDRAFIGMIDDVRIYDSALSPDEISCIMSDRAGICDSTPVVEKRVTQPVVSSGTGDLVAIPTSPKLSSEWPANADESLPMAGIFYGQYEAGLVTGNSTIAYESSRRFRAEKSGYIDAIRYNNRTLADATIENRCSPSAPGSLWCKCKTAGLDRYTCGYTLGNSYSVGNGGAIVVEVRKNDVNNGDRPALNALAKTAGVFVPLERANEHYPVLPLEQPVWLEAGEIYHLVYTNSNPPTRCKLAGMSVSDAANCPRNQGAMGLNGTSQPVLFGSSKKFGPFGGDTAGNLVRTSPNGDWGDVSTRLSWYEVRYSDGVWVGDAHTGHDSLGNGRKFIGGNTVGRQVFTVKDSSRSLDGLWVYHGHSYVTRPDGSALSVAVKDSQNRILATGSIESSRECASTASNGYQTNDFREQHCRVWGYTDLSTPVEILEGQTYSVEFSASDNAGFSLHTFFPLNYGAWKSTSRNFWNDAHAEVSEDGGRSWARWAGSYHADRDINLLFTVSGMPKQLQ